VLIVAEVPTGNRGESAIKECRLRKLIKSKYGGAEHLIGIYISFRYDKALIFLGGVTN